MVMSDNKLKQKRSWGFDTMTKEKKKQTNKQGNKQIGQSSLA